MIGYRISRPALDRQIDAVSPDWRSDAADGKKPAWSKIKEVFMRAQHFKCGYCERWMPRPQQPPDNDDSGAKSRTREYDVEHYRPKGAVRVWPNKNSPFSYAFSTGPALPGGYSWLSHDHRNYLVSCKTCNEDNKKDFFPVAGVRGDHGASTNALQKQEKPFLLHPFGTVDDPPERLIAFEGYKAVPVATQGYRHQRARVTIDFFGLNLRDDLILQRCALILLMWPYLEQRRAGTADQKQVAREEISDFLSPAFNHANCARSYEKVYQNDRQLARKYYEEARLRTRDIAALIGGGSGG